jgi:hypothetical protein
MMFRFALSVLVFGAAFRTFPNLVAVFHTRNDVLGVGFILRGSSVFEEEDVLKFPTSSSWLKLNML